jgi:hypothetical protein
VAAWVDQNSYFGPDRRKQRGGMRMRDRRHDNLVGRPPCLRTALRQLRMRVIDAEGQAGLNTFIQRTQGVITLAQEHREVEVVRMLQSMCLQLNRAGNRDARPAIYNYLDKVYEKVLGAE